MPQLTADPIVDPGEWDILNAAGINNPGVFVLGCADRNYKWDVKDAPGVQGAILTYRGWRPTDGIKGTFLFWEPGQVEQFYTQYLPIFALDALKVNPKPVSVYHPSLRSNDITALVCKKIGQLVGTPQQLWSVTLEWIEFRPARIIRSETPSGATAVAGRPTPQSKLQAEIQKELNLARQPL